MNKKRVRVLAFLLATILALSSALPVSAAGEEEVRLLQGRGTKELKDIIHEMGVTIGVFEDTEAEEYDGKEIDKILRRFPQSDEGPPLEKADFLRMLSGNEKKLPTHKNESNNLLYSKSEVEELVWKLMDGRILPLLTAVDNEHKIHRVHTIIVRSDSPSEIALAASFSPDVIEVRPPAPPEHEQEWMAQYQKLSEKTPAILLPYIDITSTKTEPVKISKKGRCRYKISIVPSIEYSASLQGRKLMDLFEDPEFARDLEAFYDEVIAPIHRLRYAGLTDLESIRLVYQVMNERYFFDWEQLRLLQACKWPDVRTYTLRGIYKGGLICEGYVKIALFIFHGIGLPAIPMRGHAFGDAVTAHRWLAFLQLDGDLAVESDPSQACSDKLYFIENYTVLSEKARSEYSKFSLYETLLFSIASQ